MCLTLFSFNDTFSKKIPQSKTDLQFYFQRSIDVDLKREKIISNE